MSNALTPAFVIEKYEAYKAAQRSGSTQATSNWPTALAHDCEAYATYNRTVPPELRRKIDVGLAMIFSEGNDQARMVRRDLIDAGFEVAGEEGQMTWPKYEISGRRDFTIWKEGMKERVRVELKSCSPYSFLAIKKPEDLIDTDKDWLKKWYRQVALYMVLQGVETYWLMLKSKSSGEIKILEFKWNDQIAQEAEKMIAKAERTNKLVRLGDPPPAHTKISDPDVCCECPFFDVCLPEMLMGPGAVVFGEEDVTELTAQLNRRAELEPLVKEYKALDDDLKSMVKSAGSDGQTRFVIGEWISTIKEVNKSAYTVKAHTEKHVKFLKTEAVAK